MENSSSLQPEPSIRTTIADTGSIAAAAPSPSRGSPTRSSRASASASIIPAIDSSGRTALTSTGARCRPRLRGGPAWATPAAAAGPATAYRLGLGVHVEPLGVEVAGRDDRLIIALPNQVSSPVSGSVNGKSMPSRFNSYGVGGSHGSLFSMKSTSTPRWASSSHHCSGRNGRSIHSRNSSRRAASSAV